MQAKLIKTGEGNPQLAVVVLGWASGPGLVSHLVSPGCDILAVYDYSDIGDIIERGTIPGKIQKTILSYPRRRLIAWSFGIWVAERLFPGILFDRAIAVNGTPLPTDEKLGIGSRRLAVTIRGLGHGGMEPFNRKAYGPWYGKALQEQTAPIERYLDELTTLVTLSAVPYTPSIDWNRALVGTLDEIFPPENMVRYWGNRVKELNLIHYPFGDPNITEELF